MTKLLDKPRDIERKIAYRYNSDVLDNTEKTEKLLLNTTPNYSYYLIAVNNNLIKAIEDVKRRPQYYANPNNLPERFKDKISDKHIMWNGRTFVLENIVAFGEIDYTTKRFDDYVLRFFKPKHKDGWYWNYRRKHYHNCGVGFIDAMYMWESALSCVDNPTHVVIYKIPNETD